MALKELKQIFTIDPVGRAAHNMALICKRWYLFTLSHELSTKAYAIYTARTKEQILQDHRKWNTAHGLEDEHVDVLPYAYGSAKFHKTPLKLRFLAGISDDGSHKQHQPENVSHIYDRPVHSARSCQQPHQKL